MSKVMSSVIELSFCPYFIKDITFAFVTKKLVPLIHSYLKCSLKSFNVHTVPFSDFS